ncbi:diguanylate cyclase [Pseudomonas sp. FW305-E2]|nr:diguanylate cyclase [Pseudomonas sp. FW305-E2]
MVGASSRLQAVNVGAGMPTLTGKAGALQRGGCFAGSPAPTDRASTER